MATRFVNNDGNRAIHVKKDHFSGGANVFGGGKDDLSACVRGLAIDHARIKIETSNISDPTVNLTGQDNRKIKALTIPTADFDASSSGGVTAASFNGVMGQYADVFASIAEYLNAPGSAIGLVPLTWATGAFTDDTIANVSATTSAGNGATAATRVSAAAAMTKAANNFSTVLRGVNALAAALGYPRFTDLSGGSAYTDREIREMGVASNSSDGTDAISKTVVDTFFTNLRENLVSALQYVIRMVGTVPDENLVDNTGASAGTSYADPTLPGAFDGDGTANNLALKSAFDTRLQTIADNFAETVDFANDLSERMGLTQLTNNTGGTPNSGRELENLAAVTATDGSTSGDEAVDFATARTIVETIRDNAWKISNRVNELSLYFGEEAFQNSITTSENFSVSDALVLADQAGPTGAGNDGLTTDSTMSTAAVDTFLGEIEVFLATWAQQLNKFTGSGVNTRPLHVIAAD